MEGARKEAKHEDLVKLVTELREKGTSKLAIVKAVWDASNMGLKDSKEFVDQEL